MGPRSSLLPLPKTVSSPALPLAPPSPLPPGLPTPLTGLIVANQQVDVGLLNALELLTEVGATANPLCLGPDHLKEGKPNSLAWASWLLASVSLHQPSVRERGGTLWPGQIPEDTRLQVKLSQAVYSQPTTHTISPGLYPLKTFPFDRPS